jgi:hypothetical protein
MVELQTAVIEIMVIEEGETPFAMLTDLWIKHREWVFESSLLLLTRRTRWGAR